MNKNKSSLDTINNNKAKLILSLAKKNICLLFYLATAKA